MGSARWGKRGTHNIVLHSVYFGVGVITLDSVLVEVVLDVEDFQDANLTKGPACDFLGELLVRSCDLLRVLPRTAQTDAALNLGVKPCILKHFGRSEDRKAGRVSCLHRGDQRQLLTNGEWVLHTLDLLLGVVRVCGSRGPEDWGQKRAVVPKSLSDSSGKGNELLSGTCPLEKVLNVGSDGVWSGYEQDIMLIRGRDGIVVEMVYHQRIAVCGEVDVELDEERDERCRGWDR